LTVFIALLGSARIKTEQKNVGEIDPSVDKLGRPSHNMIFFTFFQLFFQVQNEKKYQEYGCFLELFGIGQPQQLN